MSHFEKYARFDVAGPIGRAVLAVAFLLAGIHIAGAADTDAIVERNIGAQRNRATQFPRSEGDQAMVDGWPLYRTERGQQAFNAAMATLKATEGPAPNAAAFKGCADLACQLSLPAIGQDGFIPSGRLWVSPSEYVLIVHSPRQRMGSSWRRRSIMNMRYFVFHEFHNSSRNTDLYDTISSHSGGVFVPFYMSKSMTDAQGRHFVVIAQVAPYDVVSVHASNHGSQGPGIEVARNANDPVDRLQNLAGIVVAAIAKAATPRLQVVNHRGSEGLPMLRAYEQRLQGLRAPANQAPIALSFQPAAATRLTSLTSRLGDLINRSGASPRIPVAARGIVPPKGMPTAEPVPQAVAEPVLAAATVPTALTPLAEYLRANLATMRLLPTYQQIIPASVASIAEDTPSDGNVYLLDGQQQVIGHIEPHKQDDAVVANMYVYVPIDRVAEDETPFRLEISRSLMAQSTTARVASSAKIPPLLVEAPHQVPRPTLR